jgi:hypothetical protein
VIDPLAAGLVVAALLGAAWSLVLVVLDRPVRRPLLLGLAVVETGLCIQAGIGVVALATTERSVDAFSFLAYLLFSVLVLPAAASWSVAERSRWGTGVLTVACLVVPVLVVRLQQVWSPTGA